jgi:DNA invertase Pin-like site-specific DNA recombinase/DNA-binding transcriptional regulator YiaG
MNSLGSPATLKVTTEHLRRNAYLYVRQSTLRQVLTNTESTHRQYDLRGRALALGWPAEQVIVIDTDQGQSGATATDRDGFQRLVAEVSMGRAGIVLGLEVSRLARNNADWHRLLEICALSATLILDEDGLYDPCNFNDRLLLGLKGTMSEAELHLLKGRLRGGILSKARRGELIQPLPVGLVYTPTGKVVLDPDTGVQQAISHLFATFTATGSALATVKAFRQQGLTFPHRISSGERKGDLVWGPLDHSGTLRVLHNPRYAGAFFYGRHTYRPAPGGKTTIVTLPRDQWTVLIIDAHPGYITWEQFETNQNRLAELAVAHGPDRRHGPPREGPALLQGIAVCGVCGRRMTVRYHTRRGTHLPDYVCQSDRIATAATICQAIPGAGIDTAVGAFLIDTLTPLAIETALAVADELAARADQADRLRATTVQRAQHHAEQARRRYLAVDPTNRLVADTLEADWNTALRELADATKAYERAKATAATLTEAQRHRISALATDFPTLWTNPATPLRERKRMVRLLIKDVTIRRHNTITVHIRLTGGQDHTLDLPLPLAAWQLRQTPAEIVAAIDDLLDHHTHTEIANILNARGLTSGENRPFHKLIIARIVRSYKLRTREQRLRAAGMLTLTEMATTLGVSTSTVKAWRDAGLVNGQRYNDHGQMLYHPPGPNPPTRHQGHPALAKRVPAQRSQPTATSQ